MNILNANYFKLSNAIFCYGFRVQLSRVLRRTEGKMLAIHESHLHRLRLLQKRSQDGGG